MFKHGSQFMFKENNGFKSLNINDFIKASKDFRVNLNENVC